MSDFLRDEALNALVRELNRAKDEEKPTDAAGRDATTATVSRPQVGEDDPLDKVLLRAVKKDATDLLLVPGAAPILRIAGRLSAVDGPALDHETIRSYFTPHLAAHAWRSLEERGAVDFSLRVTSARPGPGGTSFRFRVNLHRQRTGLAAAIRILPTAIPTLSALGLPPSFAELVRPTRGLVLVCGPAGAGKTTTLAALVGEINRTRTCHIVTIEEPVEYEHPNARSIVEQVEVGSDAPSFAAALRAALRQNPDVLLVGEMRDLETISIALTAAETGHLVFSTLHTSDAAQAIHRVVDVFPAVQQEQVRQQLALALNAILCQQLIPRADGAGNVPAVELLIATLAVRQHIRKERVQNLRNEITLGRKAGMIALEESLARLVRSGAITVEEAQIRASQVEALESLLKGPGAEGKPPPTGKDG